MGHGHYPPGDGAGAGGWTAVGESFGKEKKKKELLPGLEPRLLDSKSKVITITL